jgi:beta-lactamase class D
MKPFMHSLILSFILIISTTTTLFANELNQKIEEIFSKADTNATFVLYDMQKEKLVIHNQARAQKRYTPASTFKIANSLIGLETKTVKSVDEPLPYIGPENPFIASWKEDMGLRKAITISNVPIYQELARRIGFERMKHYLKSFEYGNADTGEIIDRFWLDGPLEISTLEQVEFLKKLVEEQLPVSKEAQKDVKQILLLESADDYKLYGKTGWQNAPGNGIGWFVGWIENSHGSYVFALNMDMTGANDAPKRISLTKDCLFALGLLKDL